MTVRCKGEERPSSHAASRLRLRPGRPGSRYPTDSGFSRTPEYSAHRQVHRHQSGPLRKTEAIVVIAQIMPALSRDPDTDGAKALEPPPLAVNDAVLVPPHAVPPKSYDSRAQLRRQ